MRVRTDQRRYRLTLEDVSVSNGRAISHQGDLVSTDSGSNDGWSTVSVSFDVLRPSVFGQPVDADPFDPAKANELGIILGDGRDGTFTLDVDWIDACE